MLPCVRPHGRCVASITGRRPIISVPTGSLRRSIRSRRHKIVVMNLPHPHITRMSSLKRPRPPQGGKMDINKYETMAAKQSVGVNGDEQRERDHAEQFLYEPEAPARRRWIGLERVLLLASMIVGAISHGYHIFLYPLYITDEGIYMERAWSVLREGALSPYTYYYDHAPAGWLLIDAWVFLLPRQFETFGNAINTGRVLMLLVHVGSTFLLFQITRRLSGSTIAAVVACFFFNVSPLAIFYQRQVLLDNLMVFWVLLSLYLVTNDDQSILTPLFSGLAIGISVLTKENAIFFLPVLGYLLYVKVR